MPNTTYGTPYVSSSDYVSNYPTVSQTLANYLDTRFKALANIVQATSTYCTGVSNSVASFVDVEQSSGVAFTASITPYYATSKVLVTVRLMVSASATQTVFGRLLRGSTRIGEGATAGSRTPVAGTAYGDTGNPFPMVIQFLDNPATTSAVTYKTQLAPTSSGTVYINQAGSDTDTSSRGRAMSTITLQEIPATS